ncbi:M3 family oligoendopeptidase [Virgibacillus proomii]|nr:M3 family oligoendopeptidase [Virgibacillus proomii]
MLLKCACSTRSYGIQTRRDIVPTTFEQYIYKRPDLAKEKEQFTYLLNSLTKASTIHEANKAIQAINQFRNKLSTLFNLVFIRSSIDTNNEFYQNERDFFDHAEPEIKELDVTFYKELIQSPFRKELEQQWGSQLFHIAECSVRTFSPEIIPLLQTENKLTTSYAKLIASAEVEFQGKTYTLAQLGPFTEDKNRNIRKKAIQARADFFAENKAQFDEIYDQLVKVRHKIAKTLGFRNFTEVGYLRMQRIDYNPEMVAVFRKQVRDVIVPLASKLYKKHAQRINVDTLKYYDEMFKYPDGNPTPRGNVEWVINNGKKMYAELSHETNEFFHFMLDRNLMDLEAKKGKEAGGYCTFIEDYQSPFIFANFNGTSSDIDVLTHEAGHAFQTYCSRTIGIPEYTFPTSEAAEIHSMSMEFFTWPWMKLFFEEETEKYQYTHITDSLLFIPYGVAVDEFQHLVYAHPEWSPDERNKAWKQLEAIYLPHRDYDGNDYLLSGRFWQRQGHIYEDPFYYIDYTLAQLCAFQFWKRSREDFQAAWQDYVKLCKLGGSKSFLELVKAANLASPFLEETVESVVQSIKDWLVKHDDL